MKISMKRKGFTLIELLIVVAIIAILAAIAVPNFLEAQVRAKISRVKSDMRSLATAIEAYAVDNNKYPGALVSAGKWTWTAPFKVTTPIAFITTIPMDPWDDYEGQSAFSLPIKYIKPGWGFQDSFNIPPGSLTTIYMYIENPADPGNPSADRQAYSENESPVPYVIFSVGPDKDYDLHQPYPYRTWYDSTNGTISDGNIVRCGGSGKGN